MTLQFLETVYYKIIIDFFNTLKKYNFDNSDINLKIKNLITLKTENKKFADLTELKTDYGLAKNLEACQFGNNIYLDFFKLSALLFNTTINFDILNVIDTVIIRKRHLNSLDGYNQKFVENQEFALKELLSIYKKIYLYILNTRNFGEDYFYSQCYANKNWTEDSVSRTDYSLILKYNLFDLQKQNISQDELQVINKILK